MLRVRIGGNLWMRFESCEFDKLQEFGEGVKTK